MNSATHTDEYLVYEAPNLIIYVIIIAFYLITREINQIIEMANYKIILFQLDNIYNSLF